MNLLPEHDEFLYQLKKITDQLERNAEATEKIMQILEEKL